MIPRIGKYPFFGKRFFRRVRKAVGTCHFSHFWRLVASLALLHGRRSLCRIEEAGGKQRTRQAISHFLTRSEWDAPEALSQSAWGTLLDMKWRAGDTLYLILDDTQKRKRGKKMDAVTRLFLHAEKVYAAGHTIVGAVMSYRGVVIPCAVRLWAPKEFCRKTRRPDYGEEPVKFRKITEIAGEMVRQARVPASAKVIVLFDSYYLCPAVIDACRERKFAYLGVAKKNRNFFPDGRNRDKRKLGRYGKSVLRRDGRSMKLGRRNYRLAERVGRLSKAGRVKLAFSRRGGESSWIVMATDHVRWSVKTILTHYLQRWGIEVFFKMSKQYLGLGDYQVLRYRAVERYLHLVLIAYLLLTHQALREPDVQAELQSSNSLRLSSLPPLQQQLRMLLWRTTIPRLARNPQNRRFARKITEFLVL